MSRIIAIAGLPASGKTHYARDLNALADLHMNLPPSVVIDDPRDWNKDVVEVLNVSKDKTVIIVDPWFCIDRNRVLAEDKFRKLGFTVEWIFFANDPEQCKVNDQHRGTNRTSDINWFSIQYSIPEGANVLPVWKVNQ